VGERDRDRAGSPVESCQRKGRDECNSEFHNSSTSNASTLPPFSFSNRRARSTNVAEPSHADVPSTGFFLMTLGIEGFHCTPWLVRRIEGWYWKCSWIV